MSGGKKQFYLPGRLPSVEKQKRNRSKLVQISSFSELFVTKTCPAPPMLRSQAPSRKQFFPSTFIATAAHQISVRGSLENDSRPENASRSRPGTKRPLPASTMTGLEGVSFDAIQTTPVSTLSPCRSQSVVKSKKGGDEGAEDTERGPPDSTPPIKSGNCDIALSEWYQHWPQKF